MQMQAEHLSQVSGEKLLSTVKYPEFWSSPFWLQGAGLAAAYIFTLSLILRITGQHGNIHSRVLS